VTLDRDAIAALYRSHGHVVLRRARALLGSEADAHEALQEVFAALVRNPDALRRGSSVVAWLYQATTHHCLNQLRRARTSARILKLHAAPSLNLAGSSREEALSEVRRILNVLPEAEAAAVVYHYMDGMSHAEVADVIGCSRRQVGYLLERAQTLLNHAEKTG
jgi:RNA polymerase sigma-70 factor (ECF subfamily)